MKFSDLAKFQEHKVKVLDQQTLDKLVGMSPLSGMSLKVGDRPYIIFLNLFDQKTFEYDDANAPVTKKLVTVVESEFENVELQCLPSVTPLTQRMANGCRYPELFLRESLALAPAIVRQALVCSWEVDILRFVSQREMDESTKPKSRIILA